METGIYNLIECAKIIASESEKDNLIKISIKPNAEEMLKSFIIGKINNPKKSKELLEKIISEKINKNSLINNVFEIFNLLYKCGYVINDNDLIEVIKNNKIFYNIIKDYEKGKYLENNEILADILKCYYLVDKKEEYSEVDESEIDTIKLYFKEISIYPILTREQEKDLFIKYNKATNNIEKSKIKEIIANCNLKLVASIAKNFLNKGASFQDLIQEGNIGMLMAIDHFDVNLGNKFSTFAMWSIRRAMNRAINHSKTITISEYTLDKNRKIYDAYIKLQEEMEKTPTIKEIKDYLNDSTITELDIYKFFSVGQNTISIDQKITKDENGDTLGDFIIDENGSPEEKFMKKIDSQELEYILNTILLSEEKFVIKSVYGFNSMDTKMTTTAISILLGIRYDTVKSRERVALRKLRHYFRKNNLNSNFTENISKNSIEEYVTEEEINILVNYLKQKFATYYEFEDITNEIPKNSSVKNIIKKLNENNLYEEFLYKYCNFVFDYCDKKVSKNDVEINKSRK